MKVLRILNVVFLVLTLQTLSLALPKKSGHEHHHKHHVKKSQTPTTKDATANKILEKIQLQGLGLGLNKNLPEIFGLGKEPGGENVTTKKNTTTKINGPLKTVITIAQQFKKDKNNKTHLVGQSVQSVTTSRDQSANGTAKAAGKPGFFFDSFDPFRSALFGNRPEPECSDTKPCKEKGAYCDKVDMQCKTKLKLGDKCDQPDQCSSEWENKSVCLWGECAAFASTAGKSGVFCKKDSDCESQELHCATQEDVSSISDICVPKLGDGQTCGRRTIMFHFWPRVSRDYPCMKGFACMEVGYSGRKICRPKAFLKDQEENED